MDELFIPVFILFSLLVPVLAFVLLLYAVPVRAAVTLVRAAGRREQAVVISWGMIGFRSSGAGAGQVTEVLVLGHAILTHTGPAETADERREAPAPEEVPRPGPSRPTGSSMSCRRRSGRLAGSGRRSGGRAGSNPPPAR